MPRHYIDNHYTCAGKNISPDIRWSGVPKGTKSLVMILKDPDAAHGSWLHWIIYNIPSHVHELRAHLCASSIGASLGQNSWKKVEYSGPCPPYGDKPHHYHFVLYALSTRLHFHHPPDYKHIMAAMKPYIIGTTELIRMYAL